MKKKLLGLAIASCVLTVAVKAVHEIRTPLTLLSKLDNINGTFHYPMKRVEPVLFNNTSFNIWSGAYYRSAFNAYCPRKCSWGCSCDTTCACPNPNYNFFGSECMFPCQPCCGQPTICANNTNYIGCTCCPDGKSSIAQLFFNESSFYGSEAFWPYTPDGNPFPAYLKTVPVTPQLEYKEAGVVVGMHVERKIEDRNWRVAFNADLPIKSIEVTRTCDCDSVTTVDGAFALYDNPEMYFNTKGVRLMDSQKTVGIGDLDTALVIGYDFNDRAYLEAVGGILFPTAKTNKNPGRVYYIPAGNNGHFETKIGIDAGWKSKKWVGLQTDLAYHQVLGATEKKAAQFNCATVRGIGPCVDATVKYGYFLGHFNMSIFHPEHKDLGLALGYEIYYKRQDCTKFCTCNGADRMEDFTGTVKPINPMLTMINTDELAHKIRGEVFNRWDYFELYAGASKVVGGWNCMAENEMFIGFDLNF